MLYLQSANDLGSFNLNGVYDLRSYDWLDSTSEVGKFLAAMFGWDPRPSIEQIVVWFGYLIPVTYLFLRPGKPAAPAAPKAPEREPSPSPDDLVGPAGRTWAWTTPTCSIAFAG